MGGGRGEKRKSPAKHCRGNPASWVREQGYVKKARGGRKNRQRPTKIKPRKGRKNGDPTKDTEKLQSGPGGGGFPHRKPAKGVNQVSVGKRTGSKLEPTPKKKNPAPRTGRGTGKRWEKRPSAVKSVGCHDGRTGKGRGRAGLAKHQQGRAHALKFNKAAKFHWAL